MSRPSIARRAALAVALLVGFYLFATAIAVGLLMLPWLEWRIAGRVEGRLGLFAIVGALAILWSIVPRRDRFEEPGPRLTEHDHPRLFETLRGVADATGQAMPSEVFLVAQLNAWVAQRGGVMGVGSRRVMGLGLPLMEALTIQQFRAVLAHEFGHYYGGDTRLGPWVYQTRATIERTLKGVGAHSAVLAKLFQWYGQVFLRITHGVSRQQEFTADALAARTIGARPLTEGLRVIYGSDAAFSAYWSQEVSPVLQLGARPPIAEGFRQFMAVGEVRAAMNDTIERELSGGQAGPYDTHPCLRDRIAAVAALPGGETESDDPPALTLLDDPATAEAQLISFLGGAAAAGLQPVAWSHVGDRIWMPFWREQAGNYGAGLAGLTPASLPGHAADLGPLAVRFGLVPSGVAPRSDDARQAAWVVAIALTTALRERGWSLQALPGEPVSLSCDGATIRPFTLMHDLDTGELAAADWLALCVRHGLAELDLGAAVGYAGGPAPGDAPAVRPWRFIALTYYGLVLNRTYRVIVTERTIAGARVRGLLSAPLAVGERHYDPEFYVAAKLDRRYANVDPESSAFLALDRANFQIARESIERIELIERPKWGLGGIPSPGRIVVHHAGGRRELILVGRQDAEAIVRGLTREVASTAT